MADNPNPNPAPVSREEFEALKRQMADIAMLLREQFKTTSGPPTDALPESSSQGQSCRPSIGPPALVKGNNLRLQQKSTFNQDPGSTRVDPNGRYKRKIEEYPQRSEVNILGWECREEIKIIKREMLMIKQQVKQLADLVVHQAQITRQLFTQLTRDQEKEGDEQNSNQKPSQIIPLTERDQGRLRGNGKKNNEVARRSHQWSFDNRSDEGEPSTGKDRATPSRDRKFTPLSHSRAEVLHLLISRGRIMELLPPTDPKSKRYDHTQTCLYHSNSPGHDTEECWALRHKIQNLIERGEMAGDIEVITRGT